MDKGSRYDNSRAKVLGDEEGPFRDADASVPSSEDGEPRC